MNKKSFLIVGHTGFIGQKLLEKLKKKRKKIYLVSKKIDKKNGKNINEFEHDVFSDFSWFIYWNDLRIVVCCPPPIITWQLSSGYFSSRNTNNDCGFWYGSQLASNPNNHSITTPRNIKIRILIIVNFLTFHMKPLNLLHVGLWRWRKMISTLA